MANTGKVGFIGLGLMGGAMAGNLLAGGAEVTVYDLSAEACARLHAKGARVAGSVAELARGSDVIFTSLPGPAQFEQVVLGAGGICEALRPGTAVFDLSTNSREAILKAGAAIAAKGGALLDAPVSGGPEGAQTRDLVIWVGGDKAVFDAHRGLLDLMSATPMHVGPLGAGVATKLAHNMLGFTLMRAMAESITLAVKAGLDPLDYWNALRFGSAGKKSPVHLVTQQFLPNTYDVPAFALDLACKDMTLALAMAEQLGVPAALAQATQQDMQAALARGEGKKDTRIFLTRQTERAGVSIAVPKDKVDAAVAAATKA